MNADPSVEKIPFVYLTSPPFSGSTLFSFLANTHPSIATVAEMTGLVASTNADTYLCSCGEKILECPFWKQVSAQMKTQGFSFDPSHFDTTIRLGSSVIAQRILNSSMRNMLLEDIRDRLIGLLPRHRERLEYLIARNKALATSILRITGKSVFFDASKQPTLIRKLLLEPDVDLRAVHLVRDVRGAGLSRRKNLGEDSWDDTVRRWIRANKRIERQLRRVDSHRQLRIRYEDICSNPTETMNRFFKFCGLDSHDVTENLGSAQHHIVGNRMRLSKVDNVRLDEAWRRTITVEELVTADKLAGSMHEHFGYAKMDEADLLD